MPVMTELSPSEVSEWLLTDEGREWLDRRCYGSTFWGVIQEFAEIRRCDEAGNHSWDECSVCYPDEEWFLNEASSRCPQPVPASIMLSNLDDGQES